MIDLGDKSHCICKKHHNTQDECIDALTIREKGKSVKLTPKNNSENVMAIVLDKCVITDKKKTKCDAMYLYKGKHRKYSILVELKGAGDIEKAFHQLSYTRDHRIEYKDILKKFKNIDGKQIIERFAIVSNGLLPKTEMEKFENSYKIRVKTILQSEATSPIPNLIEII